jgi:hypothetical protein
VAGAENTNEPAQAAIAAPIRREVVPDSERIPMDFFRVIALSPSKVVDDRLLIR